MSEAVLADAQFSIVRVLRPYAGFETDYQGLTSRRPIAFPGGLDENAGRTGYDANLQAGTRIPLGSKVSLWIPTVWRVFSADGLPSALEPLNYRWQVIWRMRSLADYRLNPGSVAYHLASQSTGANSQYIVPASQKVVIFEGPPQHLDAPPSTSPYDGENYATHQGFLERYTFPSATPLPPLVPGGGIGSFQQGLANLPNINVNQQVTWNQITMDAEGDEMILLVDRLPVPEISGLADLDETLWDFSETLSDGFTYGVDYGFSLIFGNAAGTFPNLGVYLMTGSNP